MSSTKNLFNMPKVNGIQPYPEQPYYSKNREYFLIEYETDVNLLRQSQRSIRLSTPSFSISR
ncbi:hypothetical protein [Tunturiibacter gelidiferens]|uniref:hypothetical protein n=1 Tax=Tunturiibacter gelidiferens TaxID=3069689 RepID=UPI003D9B27DD